jgi:hypothetical protein
MLWRTFPVMGAVSSAGVAADGVPPIIFIILSDAWTGGAAGVAAAGLAGGSSHRAATGASIRKAAARIKGNCFIDLLLAG